MKSKLLAAVLALLGAASVAAQTATVPFYLSYQGRVTDSAGNLIGASTPANRAVKFQLYTVSSGGTPVWAETQTVTISGGEFSVLIGNGTGISGLTGPSSPAPTPYKKIPDILNASTNAAGVNFYLGVTVDDGNSATTDAEISPRQQLVAGAYALRATVAESVASGAVTTAMIADSTVTTGKLADAGVTSAKIADNGVATADLAAGAVTAAKIDANSVGLWSVNGGGVYRGSGNVGIGISSPNSPLQVIATSNSAPDANAIYVYNGTNSAGNHATVALRTAGASGGSPFYSMDVAGVNGWAMGLDNADAQKFKISNAWNSLSTNPKLTITTAGNVGIGQTNPGFPLSFADALGDKITLFGQGTSHYGFGIQGGLLQLYTSGVGEDIAFGYGSSFNFTERMRVKGNGYVGIGTSNPSQKLTIDNGWLNINNNDGASAGVMGTMAGSDWWQIYGTGGNDDGRLVIQTFDGGNEPIQFWQTGNYRGGFANDGYFETGEAMSIRINGNYNGDQCDAYLSTGSGRGSFQVSVYNTTQRKGTWSTMSFDGDSNIDFPSDIRFKKDIVDAEPMLERLLQVRFRRFHWKESEATAPLSFGVIAQELEPIFPQLVKERELQGEAGLSKTVAYTEFATIASKAVQELAARTDDQVDALRAALVTKDAQIASLEARLAALEKLLTSAK